MEVPISEPQIGELEQGIGYPEQHGIAASPELAGPVAAAEPPVTGDVSPEIIVAGCPSPGLDQTGASLLVLLEQRAELQSGRHSKPRPVIEEQGVLFNTKEDTQILPPECQR